VLLAALNLRTAVTSVGPLLDELHSGIGLTGGLAGFLTTLPVLCFAALGALTPRMAHRLGEQRALTLALVVMTLGLALRALVGSPWLFLLLSIAALAGGAMGNVLLPVIIKRHFARHIGTMTAGYTTAMAIGTTLGAAVTVPIASLGGGISWRLGLGAWAVLAAFASVVWLVRSSRARHSDTDVVRPARLPVRRSRTAWALAIFFGTQSLQAYVAFGWFALFFQERAGVSATEAGLLVGLLAGLAIPISMVVPSMAARWPSQRPVVMALVALYVLAYAGMLVAPRTGSWLWAALVGVASGAFPLALTMIGLRSRTVAGTTSLSAFAQSIGYVLAGTGPLLVGVLHGATGGWTWPFVLLFVDLGVMAASGWCIARPRYVEDDLEVAASPQG
jgi:MFS transporter, CP family, cyanate transporter